MTSCCAVQCRSKRGQGLKFHYFPRDEVRRKIWAINVGRHPTWFPKEFTMICEKHFEYSQYENRRADGLRKLKPYAVPTLFGDRSRQFPLLHPLLSDLHGKKSDIDPLELLDDQESSQKVPKSEENDTFMQFDGGESSVEHVGSPSQSQEMSTSNDAIANHKHYQGNVKVETVENIILKLEQPGENSIKAENALLKRDNALLRQQLEKALRNSDSLQCQNRSQQKELDTVNSAFKKFLNPDQIRFLKEQRVDKWSKETLVNAMKLRCSLSVQGYKILRATGYPLPSYSTLTRQFQELTLVSGIFYDILDYLGDRVKNRPVSDRFCVLSFDETIIKKDYIKLSSDEDGDFPEDKFFTVLLRTMKLKLPLKQIIACHIIPRKNVADADMSDFIMKCINEAEERGFYVLGLSSEVDKRNANIWRSLGIQIEKNCTHANSFSFQGHDVYATPDPHHLLKNLKSAILKQKIYLPKFYVDIEKLPSNVVDGGYVQQLWDDKMEEDPESRLSHLIREDLFPPTTDAVNVPAAIRFFSEKTATALESAIVDGTLPKEASSTAVFIRLITDWFQVVASKHRQTSISHENCDQKYIFLHQIVQLFSDITFETEWSLLNYGMVLSALSFADMAEFLLKNGFDFVLGSHITHDAP